jgi:hypothetical protein
MRRRAIVVYVVLLCGSVAHADGIQDIPLAKCSGPQVMMATDMAALDRDVKARKSSLAFWGKLQAISSKHPEASPDRPLENFLTKEESTAFAQASAQIAVSNYYLLAETRLRRDMRVMDEMWVAAANLRDGGTLPDENSPEFRPYKYLGVMRQLFKGPEHSATRNTAECSIDLALQFDTKKGSESLATSINEAPQYLQILGLRAKYRVPEGAQLDASKLSLADAQTLIGLQKWVGEAVGRGQWFVTDMSNLRYYADMVQLQFEELKAEVLQLGPSSDMAEFDKLRTARFDTLNPTMQAAWKLWEYIDNEIPSEQAKLIDATNEIMHKKAP